MSSLNSDINTATGIFKQVVEQVAKDRQQLEEDRKKFDKEKQTWEEEKAMINNKLFGQRIVLDVGGTRYSTSHSTLTKYPESMLGVVFSGRHDLETMKCSDGSFFIDRDGSRFKYILDYLRDGEEVFESFPRSGEILLELIREAKYYQLEGLVVALTSFVQEVDVVSQDDITNKLTSGSGYCRPDYGGNAGFQAGYQSRQAISYKLKNMSRLSFSTIRFLHPVSFINCNLSNASFTFCFFGSDVTFENCLLDDTRFTSIYGLVTNSHKVSFTGSKTDKTNFDSNLRVKLQSTGKIK